MVSLKAVPDEGGELGEGQENQRNLRECTGFANDQVLRRAVRKGEKVRKKWREEEDIVYILFDQLAPGYANRNGGYTRILKQTFASPLTRAGFLVDRWLALSRLLVTET